MTRPAQRRELAEKAVATKGVSIALACRAFGVSETCFRYSPKRDAENAFIADLLEGLIKAHRTWGFGLCFLHRPGAPLESQACLPDLLRAGAEPADQAAAKDQT